MNATQHRWSKPTRMPDGHRIYLVREGYVIADNSGITPDQTDDGVLWLDQTRPLSIERNQYEGTEHISIPLRDEDGNETRTPTDAATLLILSQWLKWPVCLVEENRLFVVR